MLKELQRDNPAAPLPQTEPARESAKGAGQSSKPDAKHATSQTTKGKGKHAASHLGKGQGKDPPHGSAQVFANRVLAGEWDDTPRLTNVIEIRKSLSEGEPLPGNLIITRNRTVVEEVEAIFSAFDVTDRCQLLSSNPCCRIFRRWQFGGVKRKILTLPNA